MLNTRLGLNLKCVTENSIRLPRDAAGHANSCCLVGYPLSARAANNPV